MRSHNYTSVKVCGITQFAQALSISNLGVDAIGVVGVKSSPRYVPTNQRRKIFSGLEYYAPTLDRVWVLADVYEDHISEGLNGDGIPTVVQLHGRETPEMCNRLRLKYPNTKWWKALRIQAPDDLLLTSSYAKKVDALLLDAWDPHHLGGTGSRLPLQWLKNTSIHTPWWLAGGISAEWIPELLKEVKPWGVDASSRLEISPGIKDLMLVEALVKAVKL